MWEVCKIPKKKSSRMKFHTIVFSTSGANCGSNNAKLFKEKESTELLKILAVIDNISE